MHANPVDGGVFDIVTTESPTIIPINPKLPIGKAKGFAITLEQTGGVVISEQPLILTAPKERPQSTYGISQNYHLITLQSLHSSKSMVLRSSGLSWK